MKNKNFKLQQLIVQRGISQAEVTKLAGFSSESRLSRIIGLAIKPSEMELQKLAEVLHVPISELGFSEREV
jgi:transcriptional regulator with XRE-family HTH domain